MQIFQILDTCVKEIGSCCQDYSLIPLLDIVRKIFDVIQIIVPIFLIVMATFNFIILVVNPETKNGIKKIINQFLAALIIFLIPTFMNVVLNMMPGEFEIGACWKTAKNNAEILKANELKFQSTDGRIKTSILVNPSDYEKGEKSGGSGNGSAKGKEIVDYALKFVGKPYVYGGKWDGSEKYTGTDCSGFVQGVFKHNGIKLTRSTSSQWADTGSYTLVNKNDIRAGDLVMYERHVAILTGNGNEIVHAANSRRGIVKDRTYKMNFQRIKGIMRINGVN